MFFIKVVKKECKHISFHVQANNLYGGSLQSYLPVGDFEWVPENELESLKDIVVRSSDTDSTGYMLEVDLSYPVSLHDRHNQYPCAPDHTKVSFFFGRGPSKSVNYFFYFPVYNHQITSSNGKAGDYCKVKVIFREGYRFESGD